MKNKEIKKLLQSVNFYLLGDLTVSAPTFMLFFFSFLIALGFLSLLLAELIFDRPIMPPPPLLKGAYTALY